MKANRVLKSFEDLPEATSEWRTPSERPESSPGHFWNEANAAREESPELEDVAAVRPVRGWGINE